MILHINRNHQVQQHEESKTESNHNNDSPLCYTLLIYQFAAQLVTLKLPQELRESILSCPNEA